MKFHRVRSQSGEWEYIADHEGIFYMIVPRIYRRRGEVDIWRLCARKRTGEWLDLTPFNPRGWDFIGKMSECRVYAQDIAAKIAAGATLKFQKE